MIFWEKQISRFTSFFLIFNFIFIYFFWFIFLFVAGKRSKTHSNLRKEKIFKLLFSLKLNLLRNVAPISHTNTHTYSQYFKSSYLLHMKCVLKSSLHIYTYLLICFLFDMLTYICYINVYISMLYVKDINECLLRGGHGPCQDTCLNILGGYTCTCENLKGTQLSKDSHSCEEIDLCSINNGGCSHTCHNTIGRN